MTCSVFFGLLFAGDQNDPAWLQLEAKIKERFNWQDWKVVLYSMESWLKNNQMVHTTSHNLTIWIK